MKDKTCIIKENRQISPDFYLLSFTWEESWGVPQIGNFLELKVSDTTAPLLRRPFAFSAYDSEKQVASMIYQRRGISTELLKDKVVGDSVEIIAPIGNSFGTTGSADKIIAVAGGVGLGPILFSALEAKKEGKEVIFVTGFRNSELVPDQTLFADLDATLCTDDGSEGFKGNVVQYLNTLSDEDIAGATIYACGPTPMLKALHTFAQENSLTCEVSMEELMACGIGACTGCVVETKSGYQRVCKEGPIFESEQLIWN